MNSAKTKFQKHPFRKYFNRKSYTNLFRKTDKSYGKCYDLLLPD
jgi:hypothetical protein